MDTLKKTQQMVSRWMQWAEPLESGLVFSGGVEIEHGFGSRRKKTLPFGVNTLHVKRRHHKKNER